MKTRVDKVKISEQEMEYCPSVGFESAKSEFYLDANLVSKFVKVLAFVPDLKVDRFIPVVIPYVFFFVDNFCKVALFYDCLLL